MAESQHEGKERVCFLEYESGFTLSPKCIQAETAKPGIYNVQYTREGIFYVSQNIIMDDYVDIKGEEQQTIIAEIKDFAKKSHLFTQYGVVHKRGILLHGPPGCGKSCFLNNLLLDFVKDKGLAFIIKNGENIQTTIDGLKDLKKITPSQQIVVIIEEVDKYPPQFEQDILGFLDGQNSLQNMIVIATANNLDNLNPALLRPSRFDWIIEFNNLDARQREIYLRSKNTDTIDIKKWVSDTDKFTIAMLKELFISVILLDNDYNLALKKIQSTNDKHQKQSSFRPVVGFKS